MSSWLMLMFRIPTEPSAPRVSTWRKLKRLGALVLHDAVWVLPATPTTREQLQWLAADITESGGEATVWRSELEVGEDASLVARFRERSEAAYAEILADLHREDADVGLLARRYQQVKAFDYFPSHLGELVRAELVATKAGDGP